MKTIISANPTSSKRLIPLLAAANFLAALGGGTILRQESKLLEVSRFTETSIVAFLLGTSIGLGILSIIPHRWSRRITAFMSFGAGLASLLVLVLVLFHATEKPEPNTNDFHAWAILVLLCLRFSFWFVARSLRTEMAASQQQKLAWVDLGYYSGMVLGLAAWGTSSGSAGLLDVVVRQLGLAGKIDPSIVLQQILFADCILQFAVGMLDITWSRTQLGADELEDSPPIQSTLFDKQWYVRITAAIVFLTIGTQIVIIIFRNMLIDIGGTAESGLGPNVLATFYIAVSIGAFLFGSLNLQLTWLDDPGQPGFFGSIDGSSLRRASFASFSAVIAALLVAAVVLNLVRLANSRPLTWVTSAGFLLCLGTAALLYEILAATILVRIGKKGKELNRKNMVAVTFGFMGVGAAIALVLLISLIHVKPDQSNIFSVGVMGQLRSAHYVLVVAVVLCLVLANLAMAWSPSAVKKRLSQSQLSNL